MLELHFLFGESLFCDPSFKENQVHLEQLARSHLCLEDRDRYSIQLIPDNDNNLLLHVFVDDLVTKDKYVDMDKFPSWVSRELPRRTVWINPPSIEEKLGTERSCPWNTHYTEFYQIYHANYNRNNLYTAKYWKQFDDIEMYHPTSLALARYHYLKTQKEEIDHQEEQKVQE